MWISLACMERGTKLKTYEILPEKEKIAKVTFAMVGNIFIRLMMGMGEYQGC